jgi:hypothetical protein
MAASCLKSHPELMSKIDAIIVEALAVPMLVSATRCHRGYGLTGLDRRRHGRLTTGKALALVAASR